MLSHTTWLEVHAEKLDPALNGELSGAYRSQNWMPGFLERPVRNIRDLLNKKSVIVQLEPGHWVNGLNTDNLGGAMGCIIDHRLESIDCFSTTVNVTKLQSLVSHDAVAKIWQDREVKTCLDVATPVVNAPKVWQGGARGEGVGIAILDTGIYPHPDLVTPNSRIVAFKDFIDFRLRPYDDNGHGTHCAGDAAGNGTKSKGSYSGPAPKAKLIGVKVLGKKGSGNMSSILAGIQWCIINKDKYGIRVLSMSIGSKATASYKSDLLCRAVQKAWKAGIVVCVAAGNEGPGTGTISSPGIEPQVITVGALDDKNSVSRARNTLAGFSSRGPTIDGLTKPDVVAPGVNIISLRVPGSFLDRGTKLSKVGQWYISMSGTSMATPVCAGVAALLLCSHPGLTPNQVKNLLMGSCRTISGDPNAQGAGLVDAWAAGELAK